MATAPSLIPDPTAWLAAFSDDGPARYPGRFLWSKEEEIGECSIFVHVNGFNQRKGPSLLPLHRHTHRRQLHLRARNQRCCAHPIRQLNFTDPLFCANAHHFCIPSKRCVFTDKWKAAMHQEPQRLETNNALHSPLPDAAKAPRDSNEHPSRSDAMTLGCWTFHAVLHHLTPTAVGLAMQNTTTAAVWLLLKSSCMEPIILGCSTVMSRSRHVPKVCLASLSFCIIPAHAKPPCERKRLTPLSGTQAAASLHQMRKTILWVHSANLLEQQQSRASPTHSKSEVLVMFCGQFLMCMEDCVTRSSQLTASPR